MTNLLLVLPDAAALAALGDLAPPRQGSGGPRALLLPAASGGGYSHVELAALRYRLLGELVGLGFGVLHALPSTVLLSDPFAALYRDADIEAMSTGWDDGMQSSPNRLGLCNPHPMQSYAILCTLCNPMQSSPDRLGLWVQPCA